jgi:hypothetical protein
MDDLDNKKDLIGGKEVERKRNGKRGKKKKKRKKKGNKLSFLEIVIHKLH